MADEDMEKMVERIKVEGRTLNVYVERRTLQCYKCGSKGHVRADCPSLPMKNRERKEEEEVYETPMPVENEETENKVAPQIRTFTSMEEEETNNEWKIAGKKGRGEEKHMM